MFIDYITLMLINLVAGLVLLAAYVYFGLDEPNQKRWIPGFGVVGAIALVTGLHMTFTWPVIGSFNIAFGETTVLFGILFVGTGTSSGNGLGAIYPGHLWILCRTCIACNWLSLHQPGTNTNSSAGRNRVHFSWLRRNFFCTHPLFQKKSAFANDWRNCVNCSSAHLCLHWIDFLLGTSC